MRPKYSTQIKKGLFAEIRAVLRHGLYFLKWNLQYLLDKFYNDYFNNLDYSSNMISEWKQQLQPLSHALDLFRLKLDPNELLQNSEAVMQHHFSLLGQIFPCLDWHLDPGSGYKWSKKVWYKNARKGLPVGIDIKLPWELSRCQHFILLGEAYKLTKDQRYAREYREQILDWIKNNPVRYGPNWACTMEVGIRIANWLVALLYFIESPELDDSFFNALLKSANDHGKHIMANLENLRSFTSNHYIGNISGLYMLAVICPVLKLSKKWRKFAQTEMEKEIFKQTFADGWDFESSMAYHRLVTEMLFYPYLLADYLGAPFSASFAQRLNSMLQNMGECAKPNGDFSQIGDNDNGRFLVFDADNKYGSLNVNYLLETASRNVMTRPNMGKTKSIAYPLAGRFFFKSPNMSLSISAGPKGQAGCGGHAHNDVLSFELNVNGEDIIVDPGTGVYTADKKIRNFFRSVARHNTLSWSGIEPCGMSKGLFCLLEEGNLIIENCIMDGAKDVFSARYEYKGRYHRRQITFNKVENIITVKDACSHEGALLSFVCPPKAEPLLGNESFSLNNVRFHFESIKSIEMHPSEISPAYGESVPNKIILVRLPEKECIWNISLKP